MATIKIQAEEKLVLALKQLANSKSTTVEALIKEALSNFLQLESRLAKSYSFIGIAHSGKGNISTQVDAALKEAAHRREGWSFSE